MRSSYVSAAEKIRTAHPNSVAARLTSDERRKLVAWLAAKERESVEYERSLRAQQFKRATR